MNGRKNRTPGLIGGENLIRLAVSTTLLSLAACGGSGDGTTTDNTDRLNQQGVPEVNAEVSPQTNVVETTAGTPIVLSIPLDDAPGATISLVSQPANGTAELLPGGDVKYTANAGFEGTDTIDYVLIDENGTQSTGTLFIAVVCYTCEATTVVEQNPAELPFCSDASSDEDGDGYGFENNASCLVPEIGAALDPLLAKADTVDIGAGDVVTISPLTNDSIADRSNVQFSIDVQPTLGTVLASEAGTVTYQAPGNYIGVDSMVYSISNASGSTSMANIDFNVSCDTCTSYEGLKLSWPSNPASESIDGYRIMFGSDNNPLTSTMVKEVNLASLNGGAPSAIFDLDADLNVSGAQGGCFMIKAYRGSQESEPSEATCFASSLKSS